MTGRPEAMLSGRLDANPARLWSAEVLEPQFDWDLLHLLDAYLAIEKVQVLEYHRLGLLDAGERAELAAILHTLGPADLVADGAVNMADLSFAIEQAVRSRLSRPATAWHVDRSRNDAQACAALIAARAELLDTAELVVALAAAAAETAGSCIADPMPGFTHHQAAQVITPGFFLTALVEEMLSTVDGMRSAYRRTGLCPLGSGAMAGQELAWDRAGMACHLGFEAVQPHALVSVASRGWAFVIAGELAGLGAVLSRFATDLMTLSGSRHGFFRLPDALCGISSAMPQKRNLPVLERIRGRASTLAAGPTQLALVHRGTPYSNSIEAGKEGGAVLSSLHQTGRSALRMLTAVIEELDLDRAAMRRACTDDFLGAMSLATILTLEHGVAWRMAQVIVGRYLTECERTGQPPGPQSAESFATAAAEDGVRLADPVGLLGRVTAPEDALRRKISAGSTHPDEVAQLLADHRNRIAAAQTDLAQRRARVIDAWRGLDAALGLAAGDRP